MELKNAVLQVRDLIFGEKPLKENEQPDEHISRISKETDVNENELVSYFNNFALLKMEVDKLDDADFDRRKVKRTGQLVDLAKKNWKSPSLSILNMYWDTREPQGILGDTIEEELQEILQRGGIKYKRYQMNPKSDAPVVEGETKRRGRPRKTAPTSIEEKRAEKERAKAEEVTTPEKKEKTTKTRKQEKAITSSPTIEKEKTISSPTIEKEAKKEVDTTNKTRESKNNTAPKQESSYQSYVNTETSIDLNNAYVDFKPPSELDFIQKLSAIARHCITISKVTEDNSEMNRVFGDLFDGLYVTTYLASHNALKNNNLDAVKAENDALKRELELERANAKTVEKSFSNLASSILDLESRTDVEKLEQLDTKFESWKKHIYQGGYIPEQKKNHRIDVDSQGWLVKYQQ